MRQKGQSIVEFAFIVPMIILLFLCIFYFGMMFMEYLRYSNAARTAARDISLIQHWDSSSNLTRSKAAEEIRNDDEDRLAKYYNKDIMDMKLYEADWGAVFVDDEGNETETETTNSTSVKITIDLYRKSKTGKSEDAKPGFMGEFRILPAGLRTIEFTMKLEKKAEN